jgi:hypothetical protein
MPQRERLRWPMDAGTVKWIYKTAHKNLWRIETSAVDLDDIVQEGFLIWHKINTRYETTDRRHIMSLFQTSFINHLHLLAKQRTKKELPSVAFDDLMSNYLIDAEMQTFHTLCAQASPNIKKVLRLLSSEEGRRKLRSRRRINSAPETLTHKLQRLCHIDPISAKELITAIRAHFGHDPHPKRSRLIEGYRLRRFHQAKQPA